MLQTDSDHCSPISAIKFSPADLTAVTHLLELKTIQSNQEHAGSNTLYLYEQLAFLDSLTSIEPPALKRRRLRHQHFWRDSDKLTAAERVYARSADVNSALDSGKPVTTCNQLDQADHTSAWTVCLTVHGATEFLNRKISPIGVRLYRAMMAQMQLQQQVLHVQHAQLTGLADAVMAAGNTPPVEPEL